MSDSIRLSSTTVNCPDPGVLAAFYADITGGEVTFAHADFATVKTPGGRIDLQAVDDYHAPEWPGGAAASALLHLDFLVDDMVAAEERVVRAGATRLDFQPNSEHCLVFADPVGHPFCLTLYDDLG